MSGKEEIKFNQNYLLSLLLLYGLIFYSYCTFPGTQLKISYATKIVKEIRRMV